MSKLCGLILCSVLGTALAGPQVMVNEGILEGKVSVSDHGKVYHSFQGIPYAKPPIGSRRFKAPEEPHYWTGVRKADKVGNACPQMNSPNITVLGNEDCLFLNVYTPCVSLDCEPTLPVVFHIHGGGLIFGTGDTVRSAPDWIVERDIVLVTFNYRLGMFGFLSLDIEQAPGNSGLKDQVAALRWVKSNIAVFGGDPDDITICGVSAGAASVNYLYMTDMTKGLFNKAIQISGSALNPWAHVDKPKENAFKLCKAFGYYPHDEQEALKFLLSVPAEDLILAAGVIPYSTISSDENQKLMNMIFLPTTEKIFPGQEYFLIESPLEKLKSGDFQKVPLYISFTTGEGLLGIPDARSDPKRFGLLDIDFERYVPKELCLEKGSEGSKHVAAMIKDFYYANTSDKEANFLNYVNIKGDTWFKRGIHKNALLVAEHSNSPVYYQQFSFEGYSDFKIQANVTHFKETFHANEENYIFYGEMFPQFVLNVERTRQRVLEMFTNFIKTGNPTPEESDLIPVKWKPINGNKLNYLDIGIDISLRENPNHNNMQFWDNLISNYSICDNYD